MFNGIGMQEIIVGFLFVLLFFGASKIPSIGASLGRGIREFKKALKDTGDDIGKNGTNDETAENKKNG